MSITLGRMTISYKNLARDTNGKLYIMAVNYAMPLIYYFNKKKIGKGWDFLYIYCRSDKWYCFGLILISTVYFTGAVYFT